MSENVKIELLESENADLRRWLKQKGDTNLALKNDLLKLESKLQAAEKRVEELEKRNFELGLDQAKRVMANGDLALELDKLESLLAQRTAALEDIKRLNQKVCDWIEKYLPSELVHQVGSSKEHELGRLACAIDRACEQALSPLPPAPPEEKASDPAKQGKAVACSMCKGSGILKWDAGVGHLLEEKCLCQVKPPAAMWKQGYDRYEKIRLLNPREFAKLWNRNLDGENFDEMVDALKPQAGA